MKNRILYTSISSVHVFELAKLVTVAARYHSSGKKTGENVGFFCLLSSFSLSCNVLWQLMQASLYSVCTHSMS